MAEYTIKVRRFKPESGDGPYWEDFDVELEESLSVLDALLQARSDQDGSLAAQQRLYLALLVVKRRD